MDRIVLRHYKLLLVRAFSFGILLFVFVPFGCGGRDNLTLQFGLDNPVQIVVETNSGGTTVLVSERDSGEISRINLSTGEVTTLITGLKNPEGFAIESGGNSVLVVENNPGRLIRANLSTNSKVAVITCPPLNSPSGIVLESGTSALVTEVSEGSLSRINLSPIGVGNCSDTIPLATGLSEPTGVALDLNNSILVTESSSNTLTRIPIFGGLPQPLVTNLNVPVAVAILPDGQSVLVVQRGNQTGNGSVRKIRISGPQSPSSSTIITGLNNPRGIALNLQGDTAFVTVSDGIVKISP